MDLFSLLNNDKKKKKHKRMVIKLKKKRYFKKNFQKKTQKIYFLSLISSLLLATFFVIYFIFYKKIEQKTIYTNDLDEALKLLGDKDIKPVQNFSYKCIPNNNKLYWKDERSLNIEKLKSDIQKSENLDISLDNKSDFYKRKNPKITLIITIHNQENFIKKIYTHILIQELKDIEIIFVNDASIDNSTSLIHQLMKNDKRIIYLKNDINKGQFYSINLAVLYAKGEYIHSIDPDDLLLNNILIKAYKTAKKYFLDIVQFYMIAGDSVYISNIWNSVKYRDGIICKNSEIRDIFYFGITRNLPDKLIRREIFVKAVKFMRKEFIYEDYHIHTDDTIFFALIHVANTYGFLEQIGYYYNLSPERFEKTGTKLTGAERANKDLRSNFNIMKYFLVQTDDNSLEKNNIAYKYFLDKVKKDYGFLVEEVTEGFEFFNEVLDLYLNCSFFNEDQKSKIKEFKETINNRKNSINNKLI